MTELKPCPFCGGEAHLKDGKKGQAGCFEPIYVAECTDCLCCTYNWQDTEAEAIAAWNTRTPDPALLALVGELVGACRAQDEAMQELRKAFCAVTFNDEQLAAYNQATAATEQARATLTRAKEQQP